MHIPEQSPTNRGTNGLADSLVKSFFKTVGICSVVTTLTACAGNSGTQPPSDLTRCSEPRPEICTAHYDPVCGTLADGSTATYATSCTACADAKVAGWIAGECAD